MDFSRIKTKDTVLSALHNGLLKKVLLLPSELGGQDRAENIVYIPEDAWRRKLTPTTELMELFRKGLIRDVSVVPEYHGDSFVPSKIVISAGRTGLPPIYSLTIDIW